MCTFKIHMCEILNFQIWISYAYFKSGQSSLIGWWLSPTQWTQMPIFEPIWFGVFAHIIKDVLFCNMQYSW